MFGHKEVARIHEEHVALLRGQIVECAALVKSACEDTAKANSLSEQLLEEIKRRDVIIEEQTLALNAFEKTFDKLGDTQ